MRSFFKIITPIALVVASCSACSTVQYPSNVKLRTLYYDANWEVRSEDGITYRSCTAVAWGQESAVRTGPMLIIRGRRDSEFLRSLDFWPGPGTESLRIVLANPPAEYLDPNNKTTILLDLGPGFARRMEFQRWSETEVSANLRREDLESLLAALQPSGEKTVTFENGARWRLPSPQSGSLALEMSECLRKAGLAAPNSR